MGYTRIYGAAGNDRLITGDDGFYLDGGAGADFMYGGWGYDTYIVDNQDDICAEAYNNGGGDEIRTDLATYALQVANIEILRGTNDRGQHLTATVSRIDINGAAGNDILTAGAYNDSLYGNAGDDALYGGAGNDTLYGGTGNDFMVGGAGDDTYYVDSQDDICADAPGEGTDTIINTGLAVFNCVVANIERIVGEYRSSSQALAADAGDQTIIGGRGSDILNGGRDNDTLIGNEGTDWLIGGQGNDLFVFSGTYGAGDRILDFHEGEDRISLGASGFGYYNGNLTPGTLSAAQFAVGASNSAANVGQVVFMPNTSGLYWDYNGSLEGGLILLAQMDNVHSLSASSFIVV